MYKKLTITVDEEVYKGLYKVVGKGKISSFLSDLARPYVTKTSLSRAYKEMAQDKEREKLAQEWSEGVIGDVSDEAW